MPRFGTVPTAGGRYSTAGSRPGGLAAVHGGFSAPLSTEQGERIEHRAGQAEKLDKDGFVDSIEIVTCVAAGMMSAATMDRSIIVRWTAPSLPPARRWRASRA